MRLCWQQQLLLMLGQLHPRTDCWWLDWTLLLLLLQMLLGLLLQLHGQLTDLLLLLLLILLPDDITHDLLHQTRPLQSRLVGLDHNLLARLNGLGSSDLHQVGPAIMLDNLLLNDLLALMRTARLLLHLLLLHHDLLLL